MTKDESELVSSCNALELSIEYLKGAQEGAKGYANVKPTYYEILIKDIATKANNLKKKLYDILLDKEE